MKREVELKYRVQSFETVEKYFDFSEGEVIHDVYYAVPGRDCRNTDEWLRFRTATPRRTHDLYKVQFLTYKGPACGAARPEVEVVLDGDGQELMDALNLHKVCEVRKIRRVAKALNTPCQHEITICLDEVDKLGNFVELEWMCACDRYEKELKALHDLAAELGLTELEPRSYAKQMLQRGSLVPIRVHFYPVEEVPLEVAEQIRQIAREAAERCGRQPPDHDPWLDYADRRQRGEHS